MSAPIEISPKGKDRRMFNDNFFIQKPPSLNGPLLKNRYFS
jgi:hypothetical protein